jgi:hypothetical protein
MLEIAVIIIIKFYFSWHILGPTGSIQISRDCLESPPQGDKNLVPTYTRFRGHDIPNKRHQCLRECSMLKHEGVSKSFRIGRLKRELPLGVVVSPFCQSV